MRRHQIVQTARKIVGTHGMASFTIQELAAEVGVSEGAIYRHFKSKHEILLVLVQDIEWHLLDIIAESARPNEGALSRLEHLFQRHFSASERKYGIPFVIVSEALRFADPEVRHATGEMVERYLDVIASILKEAATAGEADGNTDVKAAALMYFGMLEASVTLWSFDNRAHPLSQHRASMWSVFKNGLAPKG